jgi:tRNA(Ile)-lysidine synthetase-like protein
MSSKYPEFYNEWFSHPSWWFNPSPDDDKYITDNFSYLLDIDISFFSDIEKILIYDQLPRHVYRNESAKHIITFFLQKALEICKSGCETANVEEWVFSKLPLRHTNDPYIIHKVMHEIWQLSDEDLQHPIMKKFIKATYMRCPIQPVDQIGFVKLYNNSGNNSDNNSGNNSGDDYAIHVSKTDEVFMKFKSIFEILKLGVGRNKGDRIILSLSGGVDSMVCSVILKMLNIKWEAVFINYMNRETCIEEEEFVKGWCNHIGVKLYVRRIPEMNRATCMKYELRDLYETYTRNVRFSTYKYVAGAYKTPIVIMGHNNDDCIENILTNITQQRKYDDLKGMYVDSYQDGIRFIRPLLDIPKDRIYQFSLEYNITHLPNSTPVWSQRGQIRESVLPVLEKWDGRVVNGLMKLTDRVSELHGCLEIVVNEMIENTVVTVYADQNGNEGEYILSMKNIPNKVLCWRLYFQKKFNITASYKSIESFQNKIHNSHNSDKKYIKIPITQNLYAKQYRNKNNEVYFYASL